MSAKFYDIVMLFCLFGKKESKLYLNYCQQIRKSFILLNFFTVPTVCLFFVELLEVIGIPEENHQIDTSTDKLDTIRLYQCNTPHHSEESTPKL